MFRDFSSASNALDNPQSTINETAIEFEFNASSGYSDQYFFYFAFRERARISISISWEAYSDGDIIDAGLYIGEPGTEYPGYGADEITGWAMAAGGGSPEYYMGFAPLTSSQYFLRITNLVHVDTSGSILVIEEYQPTWDFSHSCSFDIPIVFVGYDSELFNETEFLSYLPEKNFVDSGSSSGGSTLHTYNYALRFANASYTQQVEDYALQNAVNGSGMTSKLNITVLEYQRDNLYYQDIFEPQNGLAINASAMDDYFGANPYSSDADFSIYVLNFSRFDTPDHQWEHWFNVSEPVTETGVNRHWWRLEWDNPLNFDAAFPYPGFGYSGSHYFLDPYAFQWYLNWTIIWRGIFTGDGLHDFYSQDLDEFQKENDISTDSGRQAIMRYLGSWIAELIPQYLSWGSVGEIAQPIEGSTGTLEVLLFHNVSHLGFSNADLAWTIDEPFIHTVFSLLLPKMAISSNITIADLRDWPDIETILTDNQYNHTPYPPQAQWNYYDGYRIFDILDARRGLDFNLTKADGVVTAYIFILDNASFASETIPWAGKEYTGLGGDARVTMLMELDRLYYPDRVTPRQGATDILVHEVGHAIGFPHTFSSNNLAGDFIWDVMGYYPGVGNFSSIRIEGYQRYQVDNSIKSRGATLTGYAIDHGTVPGIRYLLNAAESLFQDIRALYSAHEYVAANAKAQELDPIIDRIAEFANINDTTHPTIDHLANVTYAEGTTGHNLTWQVFDENPLNYTIFRNDVLVVSNAWNSSEITLKIDGLEVGVYNFTLIVLDSVWAWTADTVWVTVITSAKSDSKDTGLSNFTGVIIVFFGVTTIVIRKKMQLKKDR